LHFLRNIIFTIYRTRYIALKRRVTYNTIVGLTSLSIVGVYTLAGHKLTDKSGFSNSPCT